MLPPELPLDELDAADAPLKIDANEPAVSLLYAKDPAVSEKSGFGAAFGAIG